MGEIINWMGGWPKEGLLAAAEWEGRVARWSARPESAGRSGDPQGMKLLRERLAAEGWLRLPEADAADVIVVPGADAALERIARHWLQPGDAVLVERPTSRSALQAFRKAGVVPHPVASDLFGMLPEALGRSLAELQPRLVYAAPECTDPEGRAWSVERRQALLRLCGEAGVPVLIDDRQACLRYAPNAPGAADSGRYGTVWTIGEFPPGTIGGLRFGWLCLSGQPSEGRELLTGERGGEAPLPVAEQFALLSLMEEGELEPLLETMRFICGAKNGLLMEQLKRQGLPGTSWVTPQGGMHLWLSLPEGLDGDALLRGSWLNGLLFQPGGAFYASDTERCKLRLTVVHSEDKQIRAGVQRLADTMGDFLGRWG
ncbi:aminotransferase class I/II-fold pyridoxal phosphate-dependent enzyme [Cohnella thermotolerans]|uniref:aminotransferase class I/II-fold pyridoxal phosphate-dependent enzyme n=1 Tax=Cohnella thermotolerans TaxID=329858 RepID=UPI000422EC4F|nr:PLP-dependent aminotransferase family protein [Cohnella thermotolerans]